MAKNKLILGLSILILAIIGLIVASMSLGLHPAHAAAVNFVNAAATGDDDTAFPYMSQTLGESVAENCPDGIPSTCIESYAEDSWGDFMSAVFRRAVPDGNTAWDVQLIATYQEGQGFSGICIYNHVELIEETWQVTRWSGFISCDLPTSGLQGLADESAPNHMP